MKDEALQIVAEEPTEQGKLNRLREYLQHAILREMFYLTRWDDAEPNFEYLNNALQQTGYEGGQLDASNWKEKMLERIDDVDWSGMQDDVRPFLLNGEDLKVFKKQYLRAALRE